MPFKMQQLITLGILLVIIGFIIVFFGIIKAPKETSKTKVAVGGFIGFIPFGFGNDRSLVWFAAILSLVIFLVWLLFSSRIIKLG